MTLAILLTAIFFLVLSLLCGGVLNRSGYPNAAALVYFMGLVFFCYEVYLLSTL